MFGGKTVLQRVLALEEVDDIDFSVDSFSVDSFSVESPIFQKVTLIK